MPIARHIIQNLIIAQQHLSPPNWMDGRMMYIHKIGRAEWTQIRIIYAVFSVLMGRRHIPPPRSRNNHKIC